MSKPAGKLHNLCLEIQATSDALTKETWHAYSHHCVTTSPPNTRSHSKSSSTSQRASTSPQKQRKTPNTLQSWTLYLCQIVEGIASKASNGNNLEEGEEEESETESEGETEVEPTSVSVIWYQAHFDLDSALALAKSFDEDSWSTLESRIRVAWDSGCMDIMADESKRRQDRSFSHVKLSFDTKEGSGSTSDESKETKIEIDLMRLPDKDAIRVASIVASELASSLNLLKGQTESLKQERDSHRKLLQNNRRHERFREANSSLVNPGRLKRKTVDDEGFEGDDDESDQVRLSASICLMKKGTGGRG